MKSFLTILLLITSFTVFSKTKKLTVAKDGSGNFTTVQAAINAVADSSKDITIIYIKTGTYKEKLTLPESKMNVHFVGEDVMKTILTYDDYASKKDSAGKDIGTSGSASFFIYGNGFSAENITFENSSGPVGQAVAVRVTGDKAKFINCRFLGFQDTLYTHGTESRQYYYKCYIEGTVDFIFGSSICLFEDCTIYGNRGGYYTAASTLEGKNYGYVFLHCNITGNAPAHAFDLGRPWRPFAKTAFIECILDSTVSPHGWNNWGKVENEKTTVYAEYGNTGAGAAIDKRVSWVHLLTPEQAKQYTMKNIFTGWNPLSKK